MGAFKVILAERVVPACATNLTEIIVAEYARVPYADENCIVLPPGQYDPTAMLFVGDIFTTGWSGLDFSGFQPGDSVAVFGAGPMGMLCAYSAILRGASVV